jgi:hypothetical protein
VWPERARGAGFSLDALGVDVLGIGKAGSFTDIFSEEVEELHRIRDKVLRTCDCGELKCRKRKGHTKTDVTVQETVFKKVRRPIPLETVVPGHHRWELAVSYAARDAWLALAIDDRTEQMMKQQVMVPWDESEGACCR